MQTVSLEFWLANFSLATWAFLLCLLGQLALRAEKRLRERPASETPLDLTTQRRTQVSPRTLRHAS